MKSDWSSRKQFVRYSEGATHSEEIKCGNPQGSILGPLLFLIFINDLKHVIVSTCVMLGDDTNLFYSNSNINELFENVNKELANVNGWCLANKESINTSKTKCIFFINKWGIASFRLFFCNESWNYYEKTLFF